MRAIAREVMPQGWEKMNHMERDWDTVLSLDPKVIRRVQVTTSLIELVKPSTPASRRVVLNGTLSVTVRGRFSAS